MINVAQPITPFSANPYVYIFGAVMVLGTVLYYAWGAYDRLGLPEESASAVVTGKHYNPPGKTYRTVIAGNRAWSLADTTSETYVLLLNVGSEATVAIVSKALHASLQPGDPVQLRFKRTRLGKQLNVVAVSR